jgi:hypothetical protein
MVTAYRRTYADAVSWTKSTRPATFERDAFAVKSCGGFFFAGIVGFGVASIVSPETFGQRGARVLNLGWPTLALVAMIAVGVGVLLAQRGRISWLLSRNLTAPFSLRPGEERAYEAAVNALAACPQPLQARFALAWSWTPAIAACVGALFALSAAYFAVYVVLARGEVGTETLAMGLGDAVAAIGVFAAAAARLVTWRFATAVRRAVAPGYLG